MNARLTLCRCVLPVLLAGVASVTAVAAGNEKSEVPDRSLLLKGLLPDANTVSAVLSGSPQVLEGRARRAALEGRAAMVEAGAGEFTVHLGSQQRRVRDVTSVSASPENSVSIERPLRLWNKRQTDRNLALRTRELGDILAADSLHEASRDLLRQLFAVLRADVEAVAAARAAVLMRDIENNTAGRYQRGDVSAQDLRLAQAESGRAEVAARLAKGQADREWLTLQTRFPGLERPSSDVRIPDDLPLEPLDGLTVSFLSHSHELNVLRAEADRQVAIAQRARQDRLPDPTVGIFSLRERGGAEQVVGLLFAVPLPGQYRASQADAASADAEASQQQLALMERKLLAAFSERWHAASQRQETLAALKRATGLQQEAAVKALKAYQLGEGTLVDALYQQRLATEQVRNLRLHQLDHVALWSELELDLHRLWDFD